MSIRIHLNHYCLNMTLCRWPLWRSISSCSHNEKAVIKCYSISLGIPWIHSQIHCFKSSVLARNVHINICRTSFKDITFDISSKEVVWYYKIRWAGRPGDVPKWDMGLPGNDHTATAQCCTDQLSISTTMPNTAIHDNSQCGSTTQQARWFSNPQNCMALLTHMYFYGYLMTLSGSSDYAALNDRVTS